VGCSARKWVRGGRWMSSQVTLWLPVHLGCLIIGIELGRGFRDDLSFPGVHGMFGLSQDSWLAYYGNRSRSLSLIRCEINGLQGAVGSVVTGETGGKRSEWWNDSGDGPLLDIRSGEICEMASVVMFKGMVEGYVSRLASIAVESALLTTPKDIPNGILSGANLISSLAQQNPQIKNGQDSGMCVGAMRVVIEHPWHEQVIFLEAGLRDFLPAMKGVHAREDADERDDVDYP
ncbi:hypothetical protein ACOME3_004696, partial [Neoechinorhynchus agilis]